MEMRVYQGITYKYEYKSLEAEMPVTKRKSQYWFLWQLVNKYWQYQGHFHTKSEMNDFIEGLR